MTHGFRQFLEQLGALKLTNVERAVALLWWHGTSDINACRTPTELAREIESSGYPRQHTTRLRQGLEADRRVSRAKGDAFKVRMDARAKLAEQYGRYLAADTPPASPTVSLPTIDAGRHDRAIASPKLATSAMVTARPERPSVFIGSSAEGLPVAKALQENLDHEADSTIWSQGLFGLSSGTLETLAKKAIEFDFAVLVLTPDDLTTKRGSEKESPRDNVLFELGLFVGALGRERTYIVCPRDREMHLPSDLAGVTPSTYVSARSDGNLTAALGVVGTQLQREFTRLGRRRRTME